MLVLQECVEEVLQVSSMLVLVVTFLLVSLTWEVDMCVWSSMCKGPFGFSTSTCMCGSVHCALEDGFNTFQNI